MGALVQGSDGRLYVTLQDDGGSNSDGVQDQGAISVLNAGLPAPAPEILGFSPAKATPGTKITILGGSFVGTTAVIFSGDPVSAHFAVDGSGVISVIVPATATTGKVSITNAGGTSTSVKSFTVL